MDVAALSLRVDSSEVVRAANDLDRLSTASKRAAATGNQSGSITRMADGYARTAEKAGQFSNAASRAADAAQKSAAAASAGASSLVRLGDGYDILTGKLNSNFVAVQRNIAAWDRQGKAVNDNVGAIRANTGNIAAQFQDIGVTAAMGMNPLIIGLQQGTQLSAVFAQTGASMGATLRAAFASVISPAALLTIGLVAGAAALIQWVASAGDSEKATDKAAKGMKTYTTAMGYTKEEVKKLNAVTVTAGDTVKAVFQVAWARAAEALGISTDWMSKKWSGFLSWLGTATRATLAGVYAAILGTNDLRANLLNDALSGNLGMDTLTKGYKARYAQAQRFFDDVGKQAQKNARDRQDKMAKAMYDKPSGSGGKTDAEKLADIYAGATADIAIEKARALAEADRLGAFEAARLEKQTALLNSVQEKGIRVTDEIRAKVAALAEEYAKYKTAADVSAAINATTDDIQKQRDAVADQTKLVGLYGDALARATRELDAQRKLRESMPRDEVVVVANLTGGLSDDIEAEARARRLADTRREAELAAYAMNLERGAIGLTGQAALEYAFIAERLNEARRAGIELSPAEVAAINAAGEAYAAQRYAIDQQTRKIAESREVARGFFMDWINGAREGGNAFKSFADSAINSLNRIIDKLLDRTLDGFLDSMFTGGGGGFLGKLFGGKAAAATAIPSKAFPNALGGIYGTAQRFANGGAFTNTIVDSPTFFRFANGAALGEMGEAGPEAIMPLKRGPNGALGVQMHGGGKPAIRMGDITNVYRVEGAMTPDTIVAMIRQGGAATYDQVKRDLQSLLAQLDADGTFAT